MIDGAKFSHLDVVQLSWLLAWHQEGEDDYSAARSSGGWEWPIIWVRVDERLFGGPGKESEAEYMRMYISPSFALKQKRDEPLRCVNLFKHIQGMLSNESAVISETGDSWFNCQKLKLPEGSSYVFQMQYGCIGWAVGATLGYAQGAKEKRVISCIGDGSFQISAQDVSTMIRYGQKSIIFLLNNVGYTIEIEIRDGKYIVIKNWNYTALVEAFHNGEGKLFTCKVRTEEQLVEAIATAQKEKDSLCFIEVILHKDDTSKNALNLVLVLERPTAGLLILNEELKTQTKITPAL